MSIADQEPDEVDLSIMETRREGKGRNGTASSVANQERAKERHEAKELESGISVMSPRREKREARSNLSREDFESGPCISLSIWPRLGRH